MSALTPAAPGPVTVTGVLRSEWIKVRSVRSTIAVLALTVVVLAVFPLLQSTRPSYNPIDQNLFGTQFATLTVGVLGVLVITGEYSTGMVLATFGAVPRRLPVLWAKAAVLAVVVAVLTLAAAVLAFLAGQARYAGPSLAAPGAWRAVLGTALFLALIGLLGLGFGCWTRSTAGGVTTAIAFTYIFSQAGDVLPVSWQPHVIPYLPLQAGEAIYTVQPYPAYAHELLGPWAGLGVLCGYAAAVLAAAAVALRRTDAATSFGWKERVRGLLSPARRLPRYSAAAAAATAPLPLSPAAVRPVTQAAVIRAEWIKVRSVRSLAVTAAVTVVLIVAIGLIDDTRWAAGWATSSAAQRASFDPVGETLLGVRNFAAFPAGILGVLAVTGEYTTGMIRASFCGVPRRLRVLAAKATVLAPVMYVLALIASVAVFLGGQGVMGSHGVSLAAPDAPRAVAGAALYVTLAGLLGLALGFLTRSTAGGIAAFAGIHELLYQLSFVLPSSWQTHVVPYLPGNAGRAIFATPPYGGDMLHPLAGLAVYCGYAAAALAAAALALVRRDV